ncbi:serine/threonine protein kinase [Actinomadura barringtoniae]|uniref:Serine/threonine protein kinase n=1 Tax=Actinomadura barringtoniae TaxID=1427535 RepID=A0A939TAP9_9ACTN|nr:serine/threonine-protein kinase [Actinomadura barringtoniae]MBO2452692.1 serine/threonine protein kinase [Actinomadura barringtoniae]
MDPLRVGDPERVGPYRLLGRLGAGGMGQVFLGQSPGRRPVAVKLVRPELADDERFRERFASEVAAARRVGGFYTAQVVDAGPEADPPWLVTAYVPGPSLEQAMRSNGPLPEATIGVLGAGLAEGLAAIHDCGLVHRDLKPGNVILAEDGPRVIDFGIARALDASHHTRSVIGTPPFMSPEQTYGTEIGPASDVFSFGSVLVYAATGHGPFGEGPFEPLIFRIRHDPPNLAGLPAPFADLVIGCLAKEPSDRPGLSEVLDHFARTGESTGPWLPPDIMTTISRLRDATQVAPGSGPGGGSTRPATGDTEPRETATPPAPATKEAVASGGRKRVSESHWAAVGVAALLFVAASHRPTLTESWTNKSTGARVSRVHFSFDPLHPFAKGASAGVSGIATDWWYPAIVGVGAAVLIVVALVMPLFSGAEAGGTRDALHGVSWVWAVGVGFLGLIPIVSSLRDHGIGDDNKAYFIRSVPQPGLYLLWAATAVAMYAIMQAHRSMAPEKS